MLRKTLAIIVAVIIIIAAVGTIYYAEYVMPSSGARSIVIGLVAPISGLPAGTDMKDAAQLAVNEINDAGGVYVSSWRTHVNITLVLIDTTDDTGTNALNAVTQAENQNPVDLFIGGYQSSGTLADEMVAVNARIPFIITGASNDLVTRRGSQGNYGGLGSSYALSTSDSEGMSYMFHYCTTTYDYCKTVVDFYAQVMKPLVAPDRNFSLAILYRGDAFGSAVDKSTNYWIQQENLPITVVYDQNYTAVTSGLPSDVGTKLSQAKSANPDAVFIAENPNVTPLIIQAGWTTADLHTVYTAVENNQDPQFYSLLGGMNSINEGNGTLMESKMDPFMVPSYSSAVGTYAAKFNQTYGVMPGMMGADTYDAFYIAKAAIESAGTIDKASVRDTLEKTNMTDSLILTQSGRIQFSDGSGSSSSIGISYHEIQPITFMEQLYLNSTSNTLQSKIIWPSTAGSINNFNQTTFALPPGYGTS